MFSRLIVTNITSVREPARLAFLAGINSWSVDCTASVLSTSPYGVTTQKTNINIGYFFPLQCPVKIHVQVYMALHVKNVLFKTQPWLRHMNPFTHRTTKQWQFWILASVSRCRRWCRKFHGRSFNCLVARWLLACHRQTTPCVLIFRYQSVYCCLIR
jgi:hypothetical protein